MVSSNDRRGEQQRQKQQHVVRIIIAVVIIPITRTLSESNGLVAGDIQVRTKGLGRREKHKVVVLDGIIKYNRARREYMHSVWAGIIKSSRRLFQWRDGSILSSL